MIVVLPLYIYKPHLFGNPLIDAVRSLCVVLAVLMVV